MLAEQTQAPDFTLLNQDCKKVSLQDLLGKYIILYFYPKDDTMGCTKEACGIRDNYPKLKDLAIILGISADSVQSHKKFAKKYHLPFTLLSDPDRRIIKAYEANGGPFIKRITYLIDREGMIAKTYTKVNPAQHAEEIYTDLLDLTRRISK